MLGLVLGGGGRWLFQGKGDPIPEASALPSTGKEADPVAEAVRREIASAQAEAPPSLRDVLDAKGLDQLAKLAEFLPHASAADLKALLADPEQRKFWASGAGTGLGLSMIYQRWMAIDPAEALAAEPGNLVLFEAWAKVDPDAALAAARKRQGPERNKLLGAAAEAIALSDPERALALMKESPSLRMNENLLAEIANGLVKAGRWKEALEIHITETRSAPPWDLARDCLRQAPEEAFAWFLEAKRQGRSDWLPDAMESLAAMYPEKAEAALATVPEGHSKRMLLINHLATLAMQDLESALRQARDLPSEGARFEMTAVIATELAYTDSSKALEILRQLDWKNPPPSAEGAAATYPGASSISPRDFQDTAAGALQTLARHDPSAATKFLTQLPDSELTYGAYSQAVSGWVSLDSMAASRWVNELPSGPRKDSAISALVNHLTGRERDFEAALHWQMTVSDPSRVEKGVVRIFERWMRLDPQAAATGLAMPGIPENTRRQLEAKFAKP